MSYFALVARVISELYYNFGINPATLTGAIDVIIIEQEDGSYTCSPFHVRFGKLGVLRSREKIVDMEVNNEPVSLHMKLGDDGVAFFVQELSSELQVPDYLATSPLPSLAEDMMREGVKDLHIQSIQEDNNSKSSLAGHNETDPFQTVNSIDVTALYKPTQAENTVSVVNENASAKYRRRRRRGSVRNSTKLSSSVNIASEIFEMDVTTDEEDDVQRPYSTSTPTTFHRDVAGNYRQSDEEWRMTRTDSWAQSQFETADLVFSDSEVNPEPSIPSRPVSPFSDSEVDRISGAVKTGTGYSTDENTLWEWGDLPKSPHLRNQTKAIHKEAETTQINEDANTTNCSSKTPRKSTQPSEGIYLDDLLNEDPEIAKLYFPKNAFQFDSIRERDEDSESGRGASLPQSPHSVEGAVGGPPTLDIRTQVETLGSVSLSLCGGLSDGTISLESFIQKLVTYDDLSANPSLVNNSDLVLRVYDKFYNWPTAKAMILCQAVFHKDLPESTIQNLIKDNMPKKPQKSGLSSWFSWRKTNAEPTPTDDKSHIPSVAVTTPSPAPSTQPMEPITSNIGGVKSAPSSLSSSPKKIGMEILERSPQRPQPLDEETLTSDDETVSEKGGLIHDRSGKIFQKTLRLTSEQIRALGLHEGQNTVRFSVTTQYQGTKQCMAAIYLWKYTDKIVISDIDGTITKSDVLGQILPIIGRDWSQSGVAELYTKIQKNGYKFLYLSARAIGQSAQTKKLLSGIQQQSLVLPEGPILLSPTSLFRAFKREVFEKKPEEFKIHCLSDIAELFPPNSQPMFAGFGNKINDVYAYKALNIPLSHIFTINYNGELRQEHLLTFQSSYPEMCETVDHFFPPLMSANHACNTTDRDYSTALFWRDPVPGIDFTSLPLTIMNPEDLKG